MLIRLKQTIDVGWLKMGTLRFFGFILFSFLSLLLSQSGFAAIATFNLSGPAGEFVSQGQSWSFTYDDSMGSTVVANELNLVGGLPATLTLVLRDPTNGTAADIATVAFRNLNAGAPLSVGTFTIDQSANSPSLDIGFQGRGVTNSANGTFTISSLAYDGSGELSNLAATWSIDSINGPNTFQLTGSLNFVSAVPEPNTFCLGILMMGAILHRRRQ